MHVRGVGLCLLHMQMDASTCSGDLFYRTSHTIKLDSALELVLSSTLHTHLMIGSRSFPTKMLTRHRLCSVSLDLIMNVLSSILIDDCYVYRATYFSFFFSDA